MKRRSTETWSKQPAFAGKPETIDQLALATFCHAIMNSAGFLYVD
jgi:hypothetical protein